jgi:hypothetical protein
MAPPLTLKQAKQRFLAQWGPQGVACGLGQNAAGEPTLEARVQNPALAMESLPAVFEGFPVHAVFIGVVRAQSW